MGKPKPSKPKPHAGPASSGGAASKASLPWVPLVGVGAALLVAAVMAAQPTDIETEMATPTTAGAPATSVADLGSGELADFSAEHNASLLWGTYRPGVYFGLRSRTAPTALVAGLLWGALSTVTVSQDALRHQCEQDQLQKYGFTEHDGEAFASQPIIDRENMVEMQHSFVKADTPEAEGGWAARVEGRLLPGERKGTPQTVFLYLGVDGPADGGGALQFGETLDFTPEGSAHLTGDVPGVGRFSLIAEGRSRAGGADAVGEPETCEAERGPSVRPRCWGARDGEEASHLSVREVALRELQASPELLLSDDVPEASRLVLVQFVATPPFSLDFVYAPGGCDDGACERTYRALSARALTSLLERRRAAYEARVATAFNLDSATLDGAPLTAATRTFAGAVLGYQLGSLGYFYGSTSVAGPDGREVSRTSAAPLMSVVPSRPFFPRGFLWDDGFHQLLVGAWKPAIANDVLAHWLALMHSDGWIPREQILGAEAEARVPAEFMPQHRQHANPPTLLLRLQRLLDFGAEDGSSDDSWLPLARRLWPRLTRWYGWLVRTQAGELPHTFRWRGRDKNDGRLNAMTLSSGLDDYPRATIPTKSERHLDLLCWIAFASRLLGQLATRLQLPTEEAAAYEAAHASQMAALVRHHWHAELRGGSGAFCDWGLQAAKGEFVAHVVVKCGAADGSSIEHDVHPRELQGGGAPPKCPRSHPRFLFPLGDGAGGLLMRERFVAARKEREGWVEHLGYVSLFPLMLRLLPADAPQLPPLLELLRDDATLWSPYGLRSLAAGDRFYMRANAPGDAPYWRGPIWINLNYLALSGLHHYARTPGPAQARAAELYAELRSNLVRNMQAQWEESGYLWEQYNQDTGAGQRNHPFSGWSALVLLAIAEIYY